MSTVSELAEEEARQAEEEAARETEQEEEAESELDEEQAVVPPPPPPPTEPDLVALEREQARHYRALVKVFGGDLAGLVPCEECGTVGYTLPNELLASPDYRECDACAGFGQVRTGSRREGHEWADCKGCAGAGYLVRTEAPAGNGGAVAEGERSAVTWQSEAWRGDPSLGRP